MSIAENISGIIKSIGASTQLVAVSKTHPVEVILEAYSAGQRHFGENKVQELAGKAEVLPKDIVWHMIGHLQSNKVKYIAPFVGLIHGVDSFKLLKVIEKEAEKNNRVIPCLLQVHIAMESSKFGFSKEELNDMLKSEEFKNFKNIEIRGLMGMATFSDDMNQVRNEFQGLKQLFDTLKSSSFQNLDSFCELSMGMSDDYTIALEEGSTLIRLGSAIFGAR
jgi:PLP dependent protein